MQAMLSAMAVVSSAASVRRRITPGSTIVVTSGDLTGHKARDAMSKNNLRTRNDPTRPRRTAEGERRLAAQDRQLRQEHEEQRWNDDGAPTTDSTAPSPRFPRAPARERVAWSHDNERGRALG
jgi:hypothetical protein